MSVSLYNTMSRSVEPFKPISEEMVTMYTCGPTVYNYIHIGNFRTFIFEDVLKRTLRHAGYKVMHVMNITDVGHLTDDGDDGEDKMEKRARETGKSVWDISRYYTEAFLKDYDALHIVRPEVICKATDHIAEMIALIKRLEDGGHTYVAGGNVYFSIDTFPDYGKLARLDLNELRSGARIDIDDNKRNPKDFVLWFTNSKFGEQAMMWDSPWGRGYPGWHVECSAMSMKYLGEQFDIHCGGIDAVPVHHTNEIAQSEAATGHTWVNYWLHGEFLLNDTGKMSRSSGEFLTLPLLVEKGYDPMDYRYLLMGAHYRSQLKFSWQALDNARVSRRNLFERIAVLKAETSPALKLGEAAFKWTALFDEHLFNDLNAPRGLADLWGLLKDDAVPAGEKLSAAYVMDTVFGFGLEAVPAKRQEEESVDDPEALALVEQRIAAKKARDFQLADEIRDKLDSLGYIVKDTPAGTLLVKKM